MTQTKDVSELTIEYENLIKILGKKDVDDLSYDKKLEHYYTNLINLGNIYLNPERIKSDEGKYIIIKFRIFKIFNRNT